MSESHPTIPPGESGDPSPLHPDPDAPTRDASRGQDGDPREQVRTEVAADGGDPSVTPDSDPARDGTERDAETRAEVWDDESPAAHQES